MRSTSPTTPPNTPDWSTLIKSLKRVEVGARQAWRVSRSYQSEPSPELFTESLRLAGDVVLLSLQLRQQISGQVPLQRLPSRQMMGRQTR